MANRDALRALQNRLATRLQAARAEGAPASWLAVKAGQTACLFPLAQSGEIFPLSPVQRVPYARPWFMGVINLRGGLYGVVDLAGFLGRGAPALRNESSLAQASVITFNSALELNCALMVDTLAGLRKPEAFAGAVAPSPDAPAFFGRLFTDLDGVPWQEINLQALSRFPEFLRIDA